jgi:hypothetical protein
MRQLLVTTPLMASPVEPLPTSAQLQPDLALNQLGMALWLLCQHQQTVTTFAQPAYYLKATTPARLTQSLTVLLQMAAVAPAML